MLRHSHHTEAMRYMPCSGVVLSSTRQVDGRSIIVGYRKLGGWRA